MGSTRPDAPVDGSSALEPGGRPSAPAGPHRPESRCRAAVVGVVLFGLAVASLALSAVEITRVDPSLLGQLYDGREYVSLARNLLTGNGYLITDGTTFTSDLPTAYRTPGYPWLLALLGWTFGPGRMVAAVIWLQALALALAPALFFRLGRGLGLGGAAALGAAAASFLFLPLRYLSMLVQPELLATLVLVVAVERLLVHLGTRSVGSVVAFAACLAGAILLKQNLVVALVLFAIPLPFLLRRRAWLLAAAVVAGIVAPWIVRNAVVVGAPVLTTNGGVNFYLGWNPRVPVDLDGLAGHGQVIRQLLEGGKSELDADRELYRRGWEELQSQPLPELIHRAIAKAGILQRDYFPSTHNELFYLLLPVALATRRRLAVAVLLAAQLVVGFLVHPVEIGLRGLYYASLVDALALKTLGILALYYFAREGRSGYRVTLVLYVSLLLPGLVFIPVDRVTYMADALLLPAWAASPEMLRGMWRRFASWRAARRA